MPGATISAGEQVQAVNRRTNRVYRTWQPIWLKLAHVREGIGGFVDGTYLVAHPREWLDHSVNGQPNPNPVKPSPKLIARRNLARYENFGGKIIDQLKAALFREEPTRRVGNPSKDSKGEAIEAPIEAWWKNVDRNLTNTSTVAVPNDLPDAIAASWSPVPQRVGAGRTSITKFWPQVWDAAGTYGHTFIAFDREPGVPGVTAADTKKPFLRCYTPLDAVDWLLDDMGNLVEIKFLELVQRKTLDETERVANFNIRVFTPEYWALYSRDGSLMEGGPVDGQHQLGRLPVVVLYAKRRNMVPLIGHSVLDDPQLYIDLYNLTSEIRELLRSQTFGLVSVNLGPEGDVAKAQQMMGNVVGSANVLFTPGEAKYISPASDNLAAYQDERNALLRTIYRLAAIAWEADSRDAESTDSLKIKRQDLNQMLSAFADELERAELEVAELFYRATYGKDGWEARWKQDGVVIHYPESFDDTPFDVLLSQAEAALALGMPESFNKELRKRLVPKFLPDLPQEVAKTINDDIANAQPPADAATSLAVRLAAATGKGGQPDPAAGALPEGQTPEEAAKLAELQKLEAGRSSSGRVGSQAEVAA